MFARYSSIAAGRSGGGGGGSKWNVDGGDGECSRSLRIGGVGETSRGSEEGFTARAESFSPEHSGHVWLPINFETETSRIITPSNVC
jgi:hypothetical protein